jgi:hypothetical protein
MVVTDISMVLKRIFFITGLPGQVSLARAFGFNLRVAFQVPGFYKIGLYYIQLHQSRSTSQEFGLMGQHLSLRTYHFRDTASLYV